MSSTNKRQPLRVALVVGTLAQGGAEKQLVFVAQALQADGVAVRIYCLTRGEFYANKLAGLGLDPIWIGRHRWRLVRLATLLCYLLRYRPHIVQSAHFYANLYVAIAGWFVRAHTIGALRSDALIEVAANGAWGSWLLRSPTVLIANSRCAQHNAVGLGVRPEAIYHLPNVVDVTEFDQQAALEPGAVQLVHPTVLVVARLDSDKRLDRFLRALWTAQQHCPQLQGVVVGAGPERGALEAAAAQLGLLPNQVQFLGRRQDVPALLGQATMLVLCSDHEGFPNVVLEAMAAGIPVVTTPAGDAGAVVRQGQSGYVVPFDDASALAHSMVRLAHDAQLCRQLGQAGRQHVVAHHSTAGLAEQLQQIYAHVLLAH